jgi:dipeptidyl aminopeptidase/acylaminoacyl peptidase
MAGALGDRGERVEVVLYRNEVHGFLHEDNEVDFHGRLLAFFERHLGPGAPVAAPAQDPARGAGKAP